MTACWHRLLDNRSPSRPVSASGLVSFCFWLRFFFASADSDADLSPLHPGVNGSRQKLVPNGQGQRPGPFEPCFRSVHTSFIAKSAKTGTPVLKSWIPEHTACKQHAEQQLLNYWAAHRGHKFYLVRLCFFLPADTKTQNAHERA
jgi:hypothetical protein